MARNGITVRAAEAGAKAGHLYSIDDPARIATTDLGAASYSSPVALRATCSAFAITGAARFSPLDPLGRGVSPALVSEGSISRL